MSWALKGLDGPLKDKVFPLKPGITLGRQGDIVVPDTKSSAVHTRINQSPTGKWMLVDNNSKNGTRINGDRISSVVLVDGLKFFIGSQGFEVFEIKEKEAEGEKAPKATKPPPLPVKKKKAVDPELTVPPPAPQPRARVSKPKPVEPETIPPASARTPAPAPVPAAVPLEPEATKPPEVEIALEAEPEPPPPAPAPPKRRYWHELLADFVGENLEKFPESKRPVSPLAPALVLEFVRGLQANTQWTLGYGPRKIGSSVLDLPIFEPGAPAVCFEIFPSRDGIVFKTAHPGIVTVNGERLDSRVLHVGDKIRINETIIEVDFEQ